LNIKVKTVFHIFFVHFHGPNLTGSVLQNITNAINIYLLWVIDKPLSFYLF